MSRVPLYFPLEFKEELGPMNHPQNAESSYPLLLVYPLTESIELSLPYLLSDDSPFKIQVVKMNSVILQEAELIKPCVCLFCITDEKQRDELKKIMKQRNTHLAAIGKSKLDPLLRIIIISEEKQGMVLDSWQEMGAQEVIIAPIFAKPLIHKIRRHIEKINNYIAREGQETIEPKPDVKIPVISKPEFKEKQFKVHGIVLGPNTFLFPKNEDENLDKTVVSVEVSNKDLNIGEGEWVPRTLDETTGEGVWDWVISNISPPSAKEVAEEHTKLTYCGHRPIYDDEKKAWYFAGKAPKLYAKKPLNDPKKEQAQSSKTDFSNKIISPENVVFMNTKSNGIVFLKRALTAKNMNVWYFKKEEWDKMELNFFEKARAKLNEKRQAEETAEKNKKKKNNASSQNQEEDVDKALLAALRAATSSKN